MKLPRKSHRKPGTFAVDERTGKKYRTEPVPVTRGQCKVSASKYKGNGEPRD